MHLTLKGEVPPPPFPNRVEVAAVRSFGHVPVCSMTKYNTANKLHMPSGSNFSSLAVSPSGPEAVDVSKEAK